MYILKLIFIVLLYFSDLFKNNCIDQCLLKGQGSSPDGLVLGHFPVFLSGFMSIGNKQGDTFYWKENACPCSPLKVKSSDPEARGKVYTGSICIILRHIKDGVN